MVNCDSFEEKQRQRRLGYAARQAQLDPDAVSRAICERFVGLPEYGKANTVMWYLHCRSEVKTLEAVESALRTRKRCVIPYCTVDRQGRNKLGLWWLRDLDELVSGKWGILEPPPERWLEPERQVAEEELDVIMVPGVAFDRRGGRLGNGAGYYDRLLARVRADSVLAGVCYEAQLLERVATDRHDIFMNKVITEHAIYWSDKR